MSETANILIVDDDFDVREALQDVLTDDGYSVASASDGLEALDYLRKNPAPCLILLDWMMPRCDGAQFRAEQQRDKAIADIPVVLLTADTRTEEKQSLNTAGMLSKPVDLDDLLSTVATYCRRLA